MPILQDTIEATGTGQIDETRPEADSPETRINTPKPTVTEPVPLNAAEIQAWQTEAVAVLQKEVNRTVMAQVLQRALETSSGVSVELLSTESPLESLGKIAPFPQHVPNTGYSVVIERLPQRLAGSMGVAFDNNLFKGISNEPPQSLQRSALGLFYAPEKLAHFGAILYKYLGKEVLDVAFGLIEFGALNQNCYSLSTKDLLNNDPNTKRAFIAFTLDICRVHGSDEEKTVRFVLGEHLYKKLQGEDGQCSVAVILERFKTRFLENPKCRENCMAALSRLPQHADTYLAAVYTRQGIKKLMEAPEVSDHEWWKKVRLQTEEIEADPKFAEICLATDEQKEQHEKTKKEIRAFFETHAEDEPVRELSEIIGCARLKQELEKVRGEHNQSGVRCKLNEIVSRVISAVSRYRQLDLNEATKEPTWWLGSPVHTVAKKKMTCFTGPWLTAALLLKCGIDYDRILYCHVHETHTGVVGGHGSLLICESPNDLLYVDSNYEPEVGRLPFETIKNEKEVENGISELIALQRKHPIKIEFPPAAVKLLKTHRFMEIMPLTNGLTSGHMFHVGLSFLAENNLDAAFYALQIALKYFPTDPEILYYFGTIFLRRGDLENAEGTFNLGLKCFPQHVKNTYGLGLVCLKKNELGRARTHFLAVTDIKQKIWRGEFYKTTAAMLFSRTDDELTAVAQQPVEMLLTGPGRTV